MLAFLFAFLYSWAAWLSLCVVTLSLVLYLGPTFYLAYVAPRQNLKRKYGAEWALVTGASSGIGLCIVKRLAGQGLNVVMVALDDELFAKSLAEVQREFPAVRFVKCGCDLSQRGYMDVIRAKTKDLPVSIIMNNAGYLLMGFFRQRRCEDHLKNVECNAISAVAITHHFVTRMCRENRRGCVCFTSSAAGYFPSPFVVMYGAGKAFLSEFAASLAVETKDNGIDIMCVHPSYTATNLYNKSPKLGILELLNKFAATPDEVADVIIQSVGRGFVWRDTGAYAIITRILPRVVDMVWLTFFSTLFRKTLDEYKKFSAAPTVAED